MRLRASRLTALLVLTSACMTASAQYSRGVNVSGAEFGQSSLPGTFNKDYTFNSEATYRYFAARNLGLIRLPLQWERLQQTPRGNLDAAYLGLVKKAVAWAQADGCQVILDIHNFGAYSFFENGKLTAWQIDQAVNGVTRITRDDLADLWVRLSKEFSAESAVYAYDLMNEPHGSGPGSTLPGWESVSQFVLSAIRAQGDGKLVMIPGNSWSSANRWVSVHGNAGWITDPANNFMYEAHLYFDSDESGTYAKSWDAELKANPNLATVGSARLARFVEWCRSNGVRGYLGEFGVPDSDARWWAVLDDFLRALDAARMPGTLWAAGEWWGNYALSVQPVNGFMIDRPQTTVALGHLAAGTFTSVSSAGNTGSVFAPESLMAGYGSGLAAGTEAAADLPWPVKLQGASVEITPVDGMTVNAPLTFVSPGQINYLIPAGLAPGRVNVAVRLEGAVVATGTYFLNGVAPTVYTLDGSAKGRVAAGIVRVRADGSVVNENTADTVDFGNAGDRLFLVLYGTGFRNAVSPGSARLTVGGTVAAIGYFGPQPGSPGLDQINAELPRSLAGTGTQTVTLTVDGKAANPVTVVFR